MADGKWITDLGANTPLVDAARRVLTVRLKVVHEALPLALHHWTEDPEHVHQLRVSTRRAGAALSIFSCCFPNKTRKRVRDHLRQLRRAAGAARDWDVFGESMHERDQPGTPRQRPGLDFLLGYAHGQRLAAQAGLEMAGVGAPFEFERLIADTLAAVQKPACAAAPMQLGELARPWLGDRLRGLHQAASAKLDQYEHLHQVRILGKRIRYGMEIFASCFDSKFRDHYYPLVEEMQDILGRANDSHVASERLGLVRDVLRKTEPTSWKRMQAGIEVVLRYHQRRLPEQRRLFVRWWQRWVKSGSEAGLVGLVHSPPF
jgi:CHAD domain-containing protein